MNIELMIIVSTIITFLNRFLFFYKGINYIPGKNMNLFLSFSSQAILTSLWVPIVFSFNTSTGFNYIDNIYLLSTIFVLMISILKINILIIIGLGLGFFTILKLFIFV